MSNSIHKSAYDMLLENLKSMTDKTVLIVTHRSAALDICNRIIEINDGDIVDLSDRKK